MLQAIRSELKATWTKPSSRIAFILVLGVTILYGSAMILLGVVR